ncbi:MAG: hypothetical protein IT436_08440 [Phycisphaerales bacterium]|nr:hypothetical protein [Phycisphaerales bacterium]
MALLLAMLILMFVSAPFIETLEHWSRIETTVVSLVLISAVVAVGGSRRATAWAIVLVLPALASRWIHHLFPELLSPVIHSSAGLLFIGWVVLHLFRFILRAPRVDSEVLCAGIAGYLMLAMLWAVAYATVDRLIPGAFSMPAGTGGPKGIQGFTGLYFSVITLATVGYGDITPLAGWARMLAMLEAATGTFYIAIVISRLVSMYSWEQVEMPAGPGPG